MNNIATKKYTRPFLQKNLRQLPLSAYSTFNEFVINFSPAARHKSVKLQVLANTVGGLKNLRSYFSNRNLVSARKNSLIASVRRSS